MVKRRKLKEGSKAEERKESKPTERREVQQGIDLPAPVAMSTNTSPSRDHPTSNMPAPSGGDMWGDSLGVDATNPLSNNPTTRPF